jgi:hypothetical protein
MVGCYLRSRRRQSKDGAKWKREYLYRRYFAKRNVACFRRTATLAYNKNGNLLTEERHRAMAIALSRPLATAS